MKKPAWMCGETESWTRMKSGISVLSIAGKMRENVGKTFAWEVGLGAGLALVAALSLGGAAPFFATVGFLVYASASGTSIMFDGSTPLMDATKLTGRLMLRKALSKETPEFIENLAVVSKEARKEASSLRMRSLTRIVEEEANAAKEAIRNKKENEGEDERMASAARAGRPQAFSGADGWRPTDLVKKFGGMGTRGGDGVAETAWRRRRWRRG